MRKRILHNWGLKLLSLFIAVALWFVIIEFADPQESRTFRGVQVKLVNTELLEQENKAYEVLDNTDTLTVTVRAPKSVIDLLRSSDIVAEADMSKLTEINTIPITYSVQNVDFDVDENSISGSRDVVKLSVEERMTKWVTVQAKTVGDVADGYIISSTTQDQTLIEISGPKSAVLKVHHAAIELNVTDATRDISASLETILYDIEGNPLNLPSVIKHGNTDYININVEVLATKEVPVEVQTRGVPADGYLATGVVECNTDSVLIAGKLGALANVSKVVIPAEDLDITGRTSSLIQTVMIKDYLPSNIKLADPNFNGRSTVTVYVEPIMSKTILLTENNIAILNFPVEYDLAFVDDDIPYRVVVSGLDANISEVDIGDVQVSVDFAAWMTSQGIEVATLVDGTYEIPASVVVSGEGIEYDSELMIQLTVTEVVEETVEDETMTEEDRIEKEN